MNFEQLKEHWQREDTDMESSTTIDLGAIQSKSRKFQSSRPNCIKKTSSRRQMERT